MFVHPKARASAHQFFVSAKTRTAIPTRHSLVREALVQASLDPLVRDIGFVPSARVAAAQVALEAVVIVRDDGQFYLDIVPGRPLRDAEAEGLMLSALDELRLAPLTITEEDIRRQPRYTNARTVWHYQSTAVGIGMRMRIQRILIDAGPMRLGDLLMRDWCSDPRPAVMSLACQDLLELNLMTEPLGPQTIVRCRS
ncbi:hypothetical protein RPD_0022 [Rhodopseudomonas palustris BisB5]|uniref:Uncharacterized protein n=1 Tax=Rhodopseudomonas palustris (strain BisB5) TaxID=316057 RepID=Q13F77_RHOPS|nr:hypothetical protein RPD_0022 [Rhodopseudomonas palustris BisB5]